MATIEERTITEIKIDADDKKLEDLRHKALKKFISKRIDEIELALKEMCEEFEDRFEHDHDGEHKGWIKMNSNTFYYVNDVVAFVPSLESNIKWDHHKSTLPVENIDEK